VFHTCLLHRYPLLSNWGPGLAKQVPVFPCVNFFDSEKTLFYHASRKQNVETPFSHLKMVSPRWEIASLDYTWRCSISSLSLIRVFFLSLFYTTSFVTVPFLSNLHFFLPSESMFFDPVFLLLALAFPLISSTRPTLLVLATAFDFPVSPPPSLPEPSVSCLYQSHEHRAPHYSNSPLLSLLARLSPFFPPPTQSKSTNQLLNFKETFQVSAFMRKLLFYFFLPSPCYII